MVLFDDEKIAETKHRLGRLLVFEGLISYWFAQKGMQSVSGTNVGRDMYAVTVGVTMFLFVLGNSLLLEAVKLHVAPYWECQKAGRGKSKIILEMFESYEDYSAALNTHDERIGLSILYSTYYFGNEVLNDYNILGKYAECLWFVQGLILTTLTGSFVHLAFASEMLILVNVFHCMKQLSFTNTIQLLRTRRVKESEK